MKNRILIVDDEETIVSVMESYLLKNNYDVIKCYNGKEALNMFYNNHIDLIILDLMLPDLTGEEICRKIRENSSIPIIILSAKGSEEDITNGLDIGADDYVVKPFSPNEIVSRVNAVLRRTNKETVIIKRGNIEINNESKEINFKNKKIILTKTEYSILKMFMLYPGRVFTRDEIIDKALGNDFIGYNRSIDSYIKNIRKKISSNIIETVHGFGYRFGDNIDE